MEQACIRAGVPVFGVNRLRHSGGTDVRKAADLDTARALLGHSSSNMTEVYAEIDADKAREIMAPDRLGLWRCGRAQNDTDQSVPQRQKESVKFWPTR